MGDVSDEEKKVLRLLGDPRSSKKMLIMLKEPQEEGQRQHTDFVALAGTDISTYNVKVPVKTPSHNIEYVITHLPQPLEYGIEPGKSGSPIFGIFTIDGNAQFAMRARLMTADLQESVPLPSMFGDDDTKYYWDEAADKMRGVRPSDAWGSTTNPAVRDRIFILEQDLLAVMDDKAAVKLLLSYLGALFEASDKYLKTDNDTDIFFRILERHRFPHIERQTKKRLWNIAHSQLELIVQILARHIEGSSHITEPDRTALHSTLSTLSSFVTSVSSQAWSPAPLPNPGLAGPAQRLRSSVGEAMRSLGAYIGRRNPGSGSGPNDQDSPSTEQLPVYQPAGPGIDDVIRTGEAGTGTATGDQSEAGREPAPVIAIGDQSATYKPATLHIDDNDGEAGTYTAIGDQNEAGREPAPIPPVIASGDQSATDNGSTPVYKPAYKPATSHIDDIFRTGEAGTGTATSDQNEAGREPAPIPPVIASGDQSATDKPATLHIDDNAGEAGSYTATGDQNEAGREPAPIPPVIATGHQEVPTNGSTPVYKPAYKPATLHIDDILRTGEAGIGTAEAGSEPAAIPLVIGTSGQIPATPDVHTPPEKDMKADKPVEALLQDGETTRPSPEQPSALESKPLLPLPLSPGEGNSGFFSGKDFPADTRVPDPLEWKPLPSLPSTPPPRALNSEDMQASDTESQTTDKKPGAKSFLESIRSRLSPKRQSKAQSKPEESVSKPAKGRRFSLFRRSKKSGGSRSPRRSCE